MLPDAECVKLAAGILTSLDIGDITIKVGGEAWVKGGRGEGEGGLLCMCGCLIGRIKVIH